MTKMSLNHYTFSNFQKIMFRYVLEITLSPSRYRHKAGFAFGCKKPHIFAKVLPWVMRALKSETLPLAFASAFWILNLKASAFELVVSKWY